MAPTVVTLQWGTPDGAHAVVPTPGVSAAVEWIFGVDPVTGAPNFDQIWFHNGPFDLACLLEWYPHLAHLIWAALESGRVFDTMYLQRLIQIARGDVGGPLGLAPVAESYGLPPPTKE